MATRKTTKSHRANGNQDLIAVTFEGIPTDPEANFSADWDQKRGQMARMAAVLLQFSDREIERRLMKDAQHAHAAMDFLLEVYKEVDYLQAHIGMLNTLAARLLCVAHRADPTWKSPRRSPQEAAAS